MGELFLCANNHRMASSSSSKEKILKRIQEGLGKDQLPMPFPEIEGKHISLVYTYKGISPEETFAEEFIKLGGKFVFCADEQEMLNQLIALHDSRDWREMVCSDVELLQLFQQRKIDFVTQAQRSKDKAEACITTCHSMVARTGSFIFTSKEAMGRTAPVFYPVHIVVAYAHQLVDDISPALENIIESRKALPSMINLNTGPSRTADIEKTLVVGVHGPGEVYCFFINK